MTALAMENADTAMNKPVFPKEAYDYTDDVTIEAVKSLRDSVKDEMNDDDEWELIDGFGNITAT